MGCLLLLFRILLCFHLLHIHFPSFSSSSAISHSSAPLCHLDQSSALLQFKNSFHVNITDVSWDCDQPYPKTITWENGTDCCSWMGVTCDSMSGHVIGLDLSCSGLEGKFHPNSTLFRLTHLQRLNLAHNGFFESRLPSQLGGLVSLTHLNLSSSAFEGDIPSEISHLSKLASLDLSWNRNYYEHSLHDLKLKETTWKRLLQNATVLREIVLDGTNMSSLSPNPLSLLSKWSSSLVTLSLVSTRIRGHLTSDILCLPNLQELYLSRNDEIQVHLPMLNCSASLRILDLSHCSLQGSVPPSFANLTHLTSLILSFNILNSSTPSSLSNFQHLTHLDLSFNELSNSILTSLSNFQHLTHLDLSYNRLSSIPSRPLNLQKLTHLNLSSNELTGPIPTSILNLQNLTHLDFSSNGLTGSIPTSISNLQHLIHLDLSSNQLNGQIPDVLGGLTKLQTLFLKGNNLGGQLPSSLFTLTQLSSLDCSFNKFEGHLPNKMTGFSYLTELHLNDNLLSGTIPSWCLSLPSLTSLDLSNNQFTGHISAISSYSLSNLDLCGNKLLGNIPESFFNLVNLTSVCMSSSDNYDSPIHFPLFSKLQNLEFLSLSGYKSLSLKSDINANYSFSNLRRMHLRSNNLIDDPRFSGKFPKLRYLELSNSTLQGKVPKWIRDMNSLSFLLLPHNLLTSLDQFPLYNLLHLDLSSNLMTGDISSFICNATSLRFVSLSYNKFTGTFPQCLANFSIPNVLDLQMNKLYGTLPNTITCLETLNLNGNQLEGLLPKSLSNCTDLRDLNLGNNQLQDTFPHWLQNLPYLMVLVLRANKFYGPVSSLETKRLFPSLIIFDISCNSFSGPLPKVYIKNFQAMKEADQSVGQSTQTYVATYLGGDGDGIESEYDSSLSATIKGVSTSFMKIPDEFLNIDLSNNKFEGEILDVIGELHALRVLNLSHNRLTGPIPHSLGNLTNIESLDLSSNMLTGGIPVELTNLNFLEVLNLSYNNLVGEIPEGKQFNTFSNDSYEGNIGLCGLPLSTQCNKGPEQLSPSSPAFQVEEKFGFGWKPVAIGYACGMMFGMGLGCCVLLIGKPIWLVRMVGGCPSERVKKRRRGTRTHGNRARLN